MLRIKRVYDKPAKEDGGRVLVDRLWPRGMTKEAAKVDFVDEGNCAQRRAAEILLSRRGKMAGISKQVPRRAETEKRPARGIEEN